MTKKHIIKTFKSTIEITIIDREVSVKVDGVPTAKYSSDAIHEMNAIIQVLEKAVLSAPSNEEIAAAVEWYRAQKHELDEFYSNFEFSTQRPKGHEFVKLFPAMPFHYGDAACFSSCPLIPGSEFN